MQEKDWEVEAGLKRPEEKSFKKKLDSWAKQMPTLSHLGTGSLMIFLGATAQTGGGFGIKTAIDSEPTWISLGGIPAWICWFIIWLGIDEMIFRGRATNWLMKKYIIPAIEGILKSTVGEEKLKAWEEKLEHKFGKKEEENNANSE